MPQRIQSNIIITTIKYASTVYLVCLVFKQISFGSPNYKWLMPLVSQYLLLVLCNVQV